MILSLFGPDGVGKSTVSNQLDRPDWAVFSGTNVASWPDQSWHQHFLDLNVDESTINTDAHFEEKIRRVYELAEKLEATHKVVVIDSDPLHKTIIHDYLRSLPDVAEAKKLMRRRLDYLKQQIGYSSHISVHVCFQVSDQLSEDEQAKVCFERLANRSKLAFFDPKNIQQALARVQATAELKHLLTEDGDTLLTVTTDTPFDAQRFYLQIEQFQS